MTLTLEFATNHSTPQNMNTRKDYNLVRPVFKQLYVNKIGCGYGYGTVSVVGNATGTVPYL